MKACDCDICSGSTGPCRYSDDEQLWRLTIADCGRIVTCTACSESLDAQAMSLTSLCQYVDEDGTAGSGTLLKMERII